MLGTVNNDLLIGGPTDELIEGLEGADTLAGQGGNDTLDGGVGDDLLAEGTLDAGADVLNGGPGNDGVYGGPGDDFLDGGDGGNALFYPFATSGVRNDLADTGPQAVGGGMGVDALRNFLYLGGSPFNDTLLGDAGETIFLGSAGDDYMDGRAGGDAVNYGAATSGVAVDLSVSGLQPIGGGMGSDTLANIKFLAGSNFGDNLTGDSLDNGIVANGGDDTVNGLGGSDRLIGGGGNDRLDGGSGHDVARFTGHFTDYKFEFQRGGEVKVTDLRPGSPEGVDMLDGVEALEFAPLVFLPTEEGLQDAPDVPIGLVLAYSFWAEAARAGSLVGQAVAQVLSDVIVARNEGLFSADFFG